MTPPAFLILAFLLVVLVVLAIWKEATKAPCQCKRLQRQDKIGMGRIVHKHNCIWNPRFDDSYDNTNDARLRGDY